MITLSKFNPMKNNFNRFMREHNIEVDDRTFIDINDNYTLSIIPEYNYHYRDENDKMHIAPRSQPHSVSLNVLLMKRKGTHFVIDDDYQQRHFETEKDLKDHIKQLRHEFSPDKKP